MKTFARLLLSLALPLAALPPSSLRAFEEPGARGADVDRRPDAVAAPAERPMGDGLDMPKGPVKPPAALGVGVPARPGGAGETLIPVQERRLELAGARLPAGDAGQPVRVTVNADGVSKTVNGNLVRRGDNVFISVPTAELPVGKAANIQVNQGDGHVIALGKVAGQTPAVLNNVVAKDGPIVNGERTTVIPVNERAMRAAGATIPANNGSSKVQIRVNGGAPVEATLTHVDGRLSLVVDSKTVGHAEAARINVTQVSSNGQERQVATVNTVAAAPAALGPVARAGGADFPGMTLVRVSGTAIERAGGVVPAEGQKVEVSVRIDNAGVDAGAAPTVKANLVTLAGKTYVAVPAESFSNAQTAVLSVVQTNNRGADITVAEGTVRPVDAAPLTVRTSAVAGTGEQAGQTLIPVSVSDLKAAGATLPTAGVPAPTVTVHVGPENFDDKGHPVDNSVKGHLVEQNGRMFVAVPAAALAPNTDKDIRVTQPNNAGTGEKTILAGEVGVAVVGRLPAAPTANGNRTATVTPEAVAAAGITFNAAGKADVAVRVTPPSGASSTPIMTATRTPDGGATLALGLPKGTSVRNVRIDLLKNDVAAYSAVLTPPRR